MIITKHCNKLKDLLDSVESLSTELIKKCNEIDENLQHAISSTTDQAVATQYKDLSKTMVKTVNKSTTYLCRIPDPVPLQVSSQSSQQNNSASNMRSFDQLKPERLTEDAEPEEMNIYKEAFKVWFKQVCGTNGLDADLSFLMLSIFATVDKS